MRFTTILLLVACLQAAAQSEAQTITLSEKNASLKKIFNLLSKQTGLSILYDEADLRQAHPISIEVKDMSLEQVLALILQDQSFDYTIGDKSIVIKAKTGSTSIKNEPITVRGRITGENGEPVPGATITIKGTSNATSADTNGYFELKGVDEKATLVISGVSIEQQEIKVNSRVTINASVRNKIAEGEEVVVAYNKINQRSNVGAVTVVKGEQIQNLPNRSFDKSLQGLVPGLLLTSGNGQPGSAPGNFILRGIATGGGTDNGSTVRNPLIVIDGVPVFQDPAQASFRVGSNAAISNPIAQLNPSDIESISILKDAAAIALYGSKASNGVILVTTKKGKAGKTVFKFRHQTDISERLKDVDVLDQAEYLELLFEAYRNSSPGITDAQILADLHSSPNPLTSVVFPIIIKSPGDTSFYPQADWANALYKKTAMTISNEISMSGGNDKSLFYTNLEWTRQNGVMKETGFDRKSLRFNYENRLTNWLKLGLNTTLSYNIQEFESPGGPQNILMMSPLNPIRDINGRYIYSYSWGLGTGSAFFHNPQAATELNINRSTAYRGLSKLYGEIKFSNNLTLISSLGIDYLSNELKEKIHPNFVLAGETSPGNGSVRDEIFRNANFISTNVLRFEKVFKSNHSLSLLAGHEAQVLTTKYMFGEVRGISSNPMQDQLSGTTITSLVGTSFKQNLLSYFTQANYGFRNKYFLSGSIRVDGSSRFGENEQFGSYWSVGTGWIVTAERFMKGISKWVNYLKIRGSFGPAGNSAAITDQLKLDRLRLVTYQGSTAVVPDRTVSPGNPGIQWEETFTWDAGLELRLLKEHITIAADIYNRKTKNLIASNVSLPLTTGFSTITDNIGDIKNSGIELSISADIFRSSDFRWNLNANWSRNQNKLTKALLPVQSLSGNVANKVGEEYNSFYLRRWAGVNPVNGRPMWIDSTGKANEDYNAARQEIVGKVQPDGFGAITSTFLFKGIELSMMLYYQYGNKIYYNTTLLNDGSNPYINQSKAALNRWQKQGDVAINPRRLINGRAGTIVDQGTAASTRYLYDGDFARLSNVALAYNIPQKFIDQLNLNSVRVFIQGHNLITWTKYDGQDPENVNSFGGGNFLYPQQRSFSIGLNANF